MYGNRAAKYSGKSGVLLSTILAGVTLVVRLLCEGRRASSSYK